MADKLDLSVEARLFTLFQHLKIKQAHIAAHLPADWREFTIAHAEAVASLTLACPSRLDPSTLEGISVPLFVFTGDQGPPDDGMGRAVADYPDATLFTLSGYSRDIWADLVADRTDEIGTALTQFLDLVHRQKKIDGVNLPEREGEVAGLTYRVRGTGAPLILLPLALAPSQWEPLLPELSAKYCTIVVQSPFMGYAAIIEERGRSRGYLGVIRNVVNEVQPQPGEEILEVGCGTGVITRWMARHTGMNCRLTGLDINPYFLREAKTLAAKEQLDARIEFREGNGEALPFPDNRFDVTCSFTVLEEVDADRMLSEMVRVTKPGGRIAVLVRSVDMHLLVNLPLRPELRAKVEMPPVWWGGVGRKGCADFSLYKRFHTMGLNNVKMMPQLGTYAEKRRLEMLYPLFVPLLNPEEVEEWWQAVEQAGAGGTAFISQPFHGAVGKKPL